MADGQAQNVDQSQGFQTIPPVSVGPTPMQSQFTPAAPPATSAALGGRPAPPAPAPQPPPAQVADTAHSALVGSVFKKVSNALGGRQTAWVPDTTPDGTPTGGVKPVDVPRKPGGFFRDLISGMMAGEAAAATANTPHPSGAAGLALGFTGAQQQLEGQNDKARQMAAQRAAQQKATQDATKAKQDKDQLAQAAVAQSTMNTLELGHHVGLHSDDEIDQHNNAVQVVKNEALKAGGQVADVDDNDKPGNGPALMAAFNKDPSLMQGPDGFHRIPSVTYDTSGLSFKDGKWANADGSPLSDDEWNKRATVTLIDLPNESWGKQVSISRKAANDVAGRTVSNGNPTDTVNTTFGSLFGLGLKNVSQMNSDRNELYRAPKNENEAKGIQARVEDIRNRMKTDPDNVSDEDKQYATIKGAMIDKYPFRQQPVTKQQIAQQTENLNKKLANYAQTGNPADNLTKDERATLVQRQQEQLPKGVPDDIIAAIGPKPVPALFDKGQDDPAYKEALKAWGEASLSKKSALQASQGLARYQMLGQIRDYNVTNTTDQPIQTSAGVIAPGEMGRVTANELAKMPPGAILNTQDGTKIMAKGAAIRDIQYNIDNLKKSLPAIDDLDAPTKLKVLTALRDPDPSSALKNLVTTEAKQFSDPKIQQAINDLQYMTENVMLLRSVQGVGGAGSDMMRHALTALIPGPTSVGVKGYGAKQLDRLQGTLNQLKTGVPTVGGQTLNPTGGANPPAAQVPQGLPVNQLKEGVHTKFGNGQTWTLQNGKPVQVQ